MLQTTSRDPETFRIIGAAMAVHRELGHGFLEAVYREALPIEFERRKIPFRPEVMLPIRYHGVQLSTHYKADFIGEASGIRRVWGLPRIPSVESAKSVDAHPSVRNLIKLTWRGVNGPIQWTAVRARRCDFDTFARNRGCACGRTVLN
jgi:hypothetical protein